MFPGRERSEYGIFCSIHIYSLERVRTIQRITMIEACRIKGTFKQNTQQVIYFTGPLLILWQVNGISVPNWAYVWATHFSIYWK